MRPPISLTARMSILLALSTAAVLLVAGVLFVRAGNARFLDNDREELDGKISLVRDILGSAHTAADMAALPLRLRDTAFGHPGMVVLVSDDRGVLFSAGDQAVVDHLARGAELGQPQPAIWKPDERTFRIAAARFPLGIPGGRSALVGIALDISEDQAYLREFEEFLWFGIVQIGLALGWLGWVVVRHGLAPLRKVSAQVAAISAQALDRPLAADNVPRELQELVVSFNTMLARLNDSFRRLTEFSDDLAHELRTPINNLLLQTQVTLDGDANLAECRAALQANEEECQRLSRMISDMLFLAKADNRLVAPQREPLEMADEVAALIEFYAPLASEREVRLEQSGSARVAADRLLLRRALSNLISNALRYTARGQAVRIGIDAAMPGWVALAVTNPGPEIPHEQRARIFERLYRLDPSRTGGQDDNAGLGLAITKSIAELHGGTIDVQCGDGKTVFQLRLPSEAPHGELPA
ncbi:MAG TPA: heavy metal sensor histidine kinase [Rhodocyclaceae bacterium]